MSSAAAALGPKRRPNFGVKVAVSAAMVTLAASFVVEYVFRYYLNYNEQAFTAGGANYWIMRGWLVMHITGGMVALLTGPWQFWTGFRTRYARLHRWTGRVFLGGVAAGSIGALRIAIGTTYGWAFGFSLIALATTWITTAGMAYYAIRRRQVAIHKEWMVRAYVVTFAFVTFRVLADYGPTSQLQPPGDRIVTIAWACWTIPLLRTEVVLQLRRMRTSRA